MDNQDSNKATGLDRAFKNLGGEIPTPLSPQKVIEQAALLTELKNAYDILWRISSPDTRWENTSMQRIRSVISQAESGQGSATHAGLAPSDDKNPLEDKDPVEENPTPRSTPWTPEPWTFDTREGDSGGWKQWSQHVTISSGETLVADYPTDFNEYPDDRTNIANAERIVACVNALEGISSPAAVKEVITMAQILVDELNRVTPDIQIVTLRTINLREALAALGEHEKQ